MTDAVLHGSGAGGRTHAGLRGRATAFYVGLFLVTAATLILQIVETRILSVVSWYHVAFLVVGLAMFGITAGAVRVHRQPAPRDTAALFAELAGHSHALGLFIAASILLQMVIPIVGWNLPIANVIAWVLVGAIIAIPFYFSGIIVSLALTRSPFPVGRVYAVDLIGAALGCLATLAIVGTVDAPSAILWSAALASAGGLAFARASGGAPIGTARVSGSVVFALLVLLAVGNSVTGAIRPMFVKGSLEIDDGRPVFAEWNSYSRVSVQREQVKPAYLWGPAPTYRGEDWIIPQRRHQIDAVASTPAYRLEGDFARAGFLDYDVTTLAYALPGIDDVAVIGIGAGRDLVAARHFGASHVTGIEINPILVRLLLDEEGFADYVGLRGQPGIEFIVDEARSWFAASDRRFDLIQMSLIDTWAATGAGAFTLSEHGLYTVEAWRTFLDRLNAEGALTVSRHFWPGNIVETGRMISLALAVGFDQGFAEPARHIFLAGSDTVASLIISKVPLDGARLAALIAKAEQRGHQILVSPDRMPDAPVLQRMLASRSMDGLRAAVRGVPLDLTPPVDDRPFFFNQLGLATAIGMIFGVVDTSLFERAKGAVSGNLEATKTLLMFLILAVTCVFAAIVLPLRRAVRQVAPGIAVSGTVYFGAIGFGFMLIEIALLQRLSIFLGHPVYGLSIVLFSIILSTGIGSMLSDRFPVRRRVVALFALALVAYVAAIAFSYGDVMSATEGYPLLGRVMVATLITMPIGFCMGCFFPMGMRMIASTDARPTPWFWGINGAMGVLGSIAAVVISMSWGISTTLLVGAACYLLLIPAIQFMHRPAKSAAAAMERLAPSMT